MSRSPGAGIRPASRPIAIEFRGRRIECLEGDSLAAALVEAGELGCREAADGSLRGVFCGMGVCHECLVEIDGIHGHRACVTPARDGMRVERQPTRPDLAAEARSNQIVGWCAQGCGPSAANPSPSATPTNKLVGTGELAAEVVVVGAGPGGLAAAAAAAEAGADVVVLEERDKLGGQYYKQPSSAYAVDEAALDEQYRGGRRLIARAEAAGARILTGTQIWGCSGPETLHALGPDGPLELHPRALVLATGAYERGVPMPGWTLPGVYTTGAAQALLRAHQVVPGARILVSGNGPLNVQVAADLVRAGAQVVALAELAPITSPTRTAALARMASAAPALVAEGARYLAALRRAGVPLLTRHAAIRFEGHGRVERAVVARLDRAGRPVGGTEQAFEVDAVCLGFGFLPANELARALGLRHVYDERRGQLAIVHHGPGRTSREGIWVVGDSGGTGGAKLAEALGFLAGLDAARATGHPIPPALQDEERRTTRDRTRAERFQRGLWRLYDAPPLLDQLATADTPICRCEAVTRQTVEDTLGQDVASIGALKRLTRAGMGRCQGRYCAGVLAAMTQRGQADPLSEQAWFAPAPPFKPVPVGTLIGGYANRAGESQPSS
jgi:NADPH-dependent 2,4-dienoyl-CoA reductase/sulfur reductase-like enzyme